MNQPLLRIEHLPAMRVATIRSIGRSPDEEAWARLQAWAAPHGLRCEPERHRVFGFAHPGPDPEQPVHGYEFWIQADDGTQPDGAVELETFPGGLYATATCRRVHDPAGPVPSVWWTLWEQVQRSPYRWRPSHDLQHVHNPLASAGDQVLGPFLPVEPRTRDSLLTHSPSET